VKLIILKLILLSSSSVFAGEWYSLNKVNTFLKEKDRCAFSAVRVNKPKTPATIKTLKSLGWKDGDLEKWQRYTPVFCLYNGTLGKGIAKKDGCMAAIYAIDKDRYIPFRFSTPSVKNRFSFVIKDGKKCTKDSMLELLTKTERNYRFMMPAPLSFKLWESFIQNAEYNEQKIEIINDKYGLKESLKMK
jgi:hypothetical protein